MFVIKSWGLLFDWIEHLSKSVLVSFSFAYSFVRLNATELELDSYYLCPFLSSHFDSKRFQGQTVTRKAEILRLFILNILLKTLAKTSRKRSEKMYVQFP